MYYSMTAFSLPLSKYLTDLFWYLYILCISESYISAKYRDMWIIFQQSLYLLKSEGGKKTELWYYSNNQLTITRTPYMVLPLFATRFADYAGGIRVSFI